MKENNIMQEKSFVFALQIVSFYKTIVSEKKEFVLSKQLLRSGTGIGANIEEAIGGYSEKDFAHKLSISYKETRETIYWLKLLYQSEYISKEEFDRAHLAAEEITRILGKIQITLKSRNS